VVLADLAIFSGEPVGNSEGSTARLILANEAMELGGCNCIAPSLWIEQLHLDVTILACVSGQGAGPGLSDV
jgi:hypothetical protein